MVLQMISQREKALKGQKCLVRRQDQMLQNPLIKKFLLKFKKKRCFLDHTDSHPSCGVDTGFSATMTSNLTKENGSMITKHGK